MARIGLMLFVLFVAILVVVGRPCRTNQVKLSFSGGPPDTEVTVHFATSRNSILLWEGMSDRDRSIPFIRRFNEGSYQVERRWKDGRIERERLGYVSFGDLDDEIVFTNDRISCIQRNVGPFRLSYEYASCADNAVLNILLRGIENLGLWHSADRL